jgi:alanyl-tRNA synthetase
LTDSVVEVDGVKVLAARLDGVDPKTLRDTLDQLKNKLGSGVVLLATESNGKVNLIAGVTRDLVGRFKAGELVKAAAELVGGRGGGRPDMAQAGGSDPAGIPAALELVGSWVKERASAP